MEAREAGFLLLDGERRTDRLRLYLSTSELRGKLKGGVFAGREEELKAEKTIFGKDFAYIRDIANFSNVVGAYLKRQLETEGS